MMGVLCCHSGELRNDGMGNGPPFAVNAKGVRASAAMRAGDARGGAGCRLFWTRTIPSPPRASPAKFASLFRVPFAKRRGGFLRRLRSFPISARSPSPGTNLLISRGGCCAQPHIRRIHGQITCAFPLPGPSGFRLSPE